MKIEDLSNEQIEKARALATDDERIAYLKECGVDPDDGRPAGKETGLAAMTAAIA